MVPGTVLDRLFLMKVTILHQLFDIRVKPRNRRFFTRLCLIGACLSKIVLKFVFQIFQATFGLSIFSIFSHGIDAINKTLLAALGNDSIHMVFNPRTAKVKVYIKKEHGLAFFDKLSRMFGFGGEDTKLLKTTESPYVADLFGITAIYVYCNIVQPQIVGNTNVHLLRTIPVSGKSGDVITKIFTNIQYVPVQTKSFEDIEILLGTDTGDPVPFERGKVIATLYFRKQSYFN